MSGRGRVYSFTVVRRPLIPDFAAIAPYIYAIIELEEGVRLTSNIINCQFEDVYVDMPVKAVFRQEDGRKVLLFEPEEHK